MKKTILLFTFLSLFSFKNKAQTVTDIDGNVYTIVTIDDQQWLGENLKVTHYRNGDPILNVVNIIFWDTLTTGAYCDYDLNVNNSTNYGRLYNFYSLSDSRKICPNGWHVPTDNEWSILTTYLGGEDIAGGKLKEVGTSHWNSPNTGATNETGFTALPGGYYEGNSAFSDIGDVGVWWSSSDCDFGSVYRRNMGSGMARVNWGCSNKSRGYSIRCIKDIGTGIDNLNNINEIKIYPNPVIDKINIEFAYKNKPAIITIYDIIGNIVFQKQIEYVEKVFDISSLTKGIYIIEISDTQIILQKKLIKK